MTLREAFAEIARLKTSITEKDETISSLTRDVARLNLALATTSTPKSSKPNKIEVECKPSTSVVGDTVLPPTTSISPVGPTMSATGGAV